jgi:hypothetical protein
VARFSHAEPIAVPPERSAVDQGHAVRPALHRPCEIRASRPESAQSIPRWDFCRELFSPRHTHPSPLPRGPQLASRRLLFPRTLPTCGPRERSSVTSFVHASFIHLCSSALPET